MESRSLNLEFRPLNCCSRMSVLDWRVALGAAEPMMLESSLEIAMIFTYPLSRVGSLDVGPRKGRDAVFDPSVLNTLGNRRMN